MANSIRHIQIRSESPDQTARGIPSDCLRRQSIQINRHRSAPPQAGSFVQFFVGVSDLQLGLARAQELGARILIGPATLPEGDRMAVLQDPLGMPFGMWQQPGN